MEQKDIVKTLAALVDPERILTDEQSLLEGAKDYCGFRV